MRVRHVRTVLPAVKRRPLHLEPLSHLAQSKIVFATVLKEQVAAKFKGGVSWVAHRELVNHPFKLLNFVCLFWLPVPIPDPCHGIKHATGPVEKKIVSFFFPSLTSVPIMPAYRRFPWTGNPVDIEKMPSFIPD